MKSSPTPRTRYVRSRTWGSKTRILDELVIPWWLYHPGRGAWALVKMPWVGRPLLGWVLLSIWLGSWVLGFWLVLGVVCLTGWLLWRRRRAEGAAGYDPREIALEVKCRSQLAGQWPIACESIPGLLGTRSKEPPPLQGITYLGDGSLRAAVPSGSIGVPPARIEKASGELKSIIGCQDVVVSTKGMPSGVAQVTFHWRDPIGRTLPLAQLPIAPAGRLAYGIRQDGSPATIIAGQSVLIGGLTRRGKSNTIEALLADCVRQGLPVDVYASDPKGGVQLDALEHALVDPRRPKDAPREALIEVRQYVSSAKDTRPMVEAALKAMKARAYVMKQRGIQQLTTPTEEFPLVVVLLDETLPLQDMLKKGVDSPLGELAYTGSFALFVVWANAQVAQVSELGRFRDLVPQRICFATGNAQTTDSVLGNQATAAGAECHLIDEAGVGYSFEDGHRGPQKFRAALVTNEEARTVMASQLPKGVAESYETAVGTKGGRTALYRWFHASDPKGARAQYIGISYDVLRREAEHNGALRAFMAGDIRRETEWYPSRKLALEAEEKAIKAEAPIFNKVHNKRRTVDRARAMATRAKKEKTPA